MEATQEPPPETEAKDPRTDPAASPARERRWWEYPIPLFSRPAMVVIGTAGLVAAAVVAVRKAGSSRLRR